MMMPLSTIAPTIAHRVGYRRTVASGMTTLAVGLVLLALLADPGSGYLSVLPGLLVIGAGVGLSMSPSTTAITSSLTEDKQGVASALNDTVREIGAAVGLALIGSILNSRYRANITDTANTFPTDVADRIKEGIGGALSSAAQLGPDSPALVAAARNAYVDAMQPAMLLAAGFAVLAAAYTTWTGVQDKRRQDAGTPEQDN
jgi:fucose permease